MDPKALITAGALIGDPTTLGFLRWAMVGMRVEGDLQAVADALTAIPEVDYVVITAGSYDILAEVVCEDDDHLLRLLNENIRAIPQIRHSETTPSPTSARC